MARHPAFLVLLGASWGVPIGILIARFERPAQIAALGALAAIAAIAALAIARREATSRKMRRARNAAASEHADWMHDRYAGPGAGAAPAPAAPSNSGRVRSWNADEGRAA